MRSHIFPQLLKSSFFALTLLIFASLTLRSAAADERTINPSEFILMGNSSISNSEIVLTNDTSWQDGRIQTKQTICAKEYRFSYDAYVGDLNADKNGGAGVVFYEIRADDNSWLNVFEFNIQDRARLNRFNTIEMLGSAPITFATPSFTLAGNGWHHVVFHGNENVGDAVVSNAKGVISVANQRPYKPGVAIYHQFLGWTGTAHNLQKVKNFKIEIIRPDNCSGQPSLSLDEAKQEVFNSCGAGACEDYLTFINCASEILDGLKGIGVIDLSIQSSLVSEYQNKMNYCSGQTECKTDLNTVTQAAYQKGFGEGVASIDQEVIKRDAFARGVQSVDVESIKSTAYNSGFAAGVASVNVDEIETNARNEGYQSGFSDGAASIDVDSIKAEGYSEGFSAGKE